MAFPAIKGSPGRRWGPPDWAGPRAVMSSLGVEYEDASNEPAFQIEIPDLLFFWKDVPRAGEHGR
ncbi:unnamed protein product [Prunus armeniaca]